MRDKWYMTNHLPPIWLLIQKLDHNSSLRAKIRAKSLKTRTEHSPPSLCMEMWTFSFLFFQGPFCLRLNENSQYWRYFHNLLEHPGCVNGECWEDCIVWVCCVGVELCNRFLLKHFVATCCVFCAVTDTQISQNLHFLHLYSSRKFKHAKNRHF